MSGISADKVNVVRILFGNRLGLTENINELACFRPLKSGFQSYPFMGGSVLTFEELFGQMVTVVDKAIAGSRDQPVVFLVINNKAAVYYDEWESFVRERQEEGSYVYLIVWDVDPRDIRFKVPDYEQNPDYLIEHGLGVRVMFDYKAPTAGSKRLSEYIWRLLGKDRPDRLFPGYDTALAALIAEHINCENFNSFSAREGSISKYPFFRGEPLLSATMRCPYCEKEKEIYHKDLRPDGSVWFQCCCSDRPQGWMHDAYKLFEDLLEEERFDSGGNEVHLVSAV